MKKTLLKRINLVAQFTMDRQSFFRFFLFWFGPPERWSVDVFNVSQCAVSVAAFALSPMKDGLQR